MIRNTAPSATDRPATRRLPGPLANRLPASGPIARAAALVLAGVLPTAGQAQEPILGELRDFGFNFCPRYWQPAAGQLLPISANQALYSLLGTTYGGDGRTTFGLPDLRGRAAVGQSPSSYPIGQVGGQETVVLTQAEMPAHTHAAEATKEQANQRGAGGDFFAFAQDAAGNEVGLYNNGPANTSLSPGTITPIGGGQPHENRMPYLATTWCIAVSGLFPSRN